MIHKLFTQLDIAALVDMLKQQHRYGMAPVIDELVSDMIGLLKQGQQMGKTLPIRIIIAALLPVLGKIAKAVEPTHEQRSALIAELLSKVGAQLAYQGAQAKVIDHVITSYSIHYTKLYDPCASSPPQ